ncbi:MAG TPA: ROK family protein [Thermaerobacter sp.]
MASSSVSQCVLGVDLGGTKIALGLVTRDGHVVAETTVPTRPEDGPGQAVERLVAAARELAAAGGLQPLAAGVGAPGPLDLPAGRFTRSPNLPGWDGFPLRDELAARLGLPVWVDNDANVAALAEARVGAGKDARVMLYVTVGTGIGGGLVIGGRLFSGANGNGLEIGHVTVDPDGPPCGCGNRGCWEALASGPALGRMADGRLGRNPRSDDGRWTAADVLALAEEGDAAARALMEEYAGWLGLGLASMVNAFNPDRVVLGGGVMRRYALLAPVMEAEMRRRALAANAAVARLCPASLGGRAGLLGAAMLAWDGLAG